MKKRIISLVVLVMSLFALVSCDPNKPVDKQKVRKVHITLANTYANRCYQVVSAEFDKQGGLLVRIVEFQDTWLYLSAGTYFVPYGICPYCGED